MSKNQKAPTREEKIELLNTIKEGRHTYSVILSGYGGEIAIGRISKKQFEYWNDRDDLYEHIDDWDGEMDLSEELKICESGSWYDRDDIAHETGVEFSELCYITVCNEKGDEVFQSPLSIEALEAAGVGVDGMNFDSIVLEDTDAEYAFMGQSLEKGTFFTGEFETIGKFNPAKLNFSTINVDGWNLVNGVSYESEIIEDTGGYDTTGKGLEYRVFKVER